LTSAAFSRLGAVIHLASLLADQSSDSTDALNSLPAAVVQILGLNLERLQANIPHPDSFSDSTLA
jgi:hypothetical protein